MAKFVVAGKSNCPFYAKAELLADYLAMNLPDFRVHKIVLNPDDWSQWLNKTCEERSFKHSTSPLIWRELIDRGGKGLYVGGCDDFLELSNAFYLKVSEKLSEELLKISLENMQTKIELDAEREEELRKINPIKICVTGAASPVAYGIFNDICKGELFGENEEVSIRLFDAPDKQELLAGVVMEIQDCAWPLARAVTATCDRAEAFKDASLVILLDSLCFTAGKDKKEYLKENAAIIKSHAEALTSNAKEGVRVLVVGGPANVNAGVLRHFATNVPAENICALAKLQENRAKSKLAKKLGVSTSSIKDVAVWGDISFNQHVDTSNACVHGYDGAIWAPHVPDFTRSVPEMIHDEKWLTGEFVTSLVTQEEAFRETYNQYACMSMCNAVIKQLQQWIQGSPEGEYFSVGVASDGSYGIPEGVIFSLPVKFREGKWEIVKGLPIDSETQAKINDIAKEIQQETESVLKSFESPVKEEVSKDKAAEKPDPETGAAVMAESEAVVTAETVAAAETDETPKEENESTKEEVSAPSDEQAVTAEPSDSTAAGPTSDEPVTETKPDTEENPTLPEIVTEEAKKPTEEAQETKSNTEENVEATENVSEENKESDSVPTADGEQASAES